MSQFDRDSVILNAIKTSLANEPPLRQHGTNHEDLAIPADFDSLSEYRAFTTYKLLTESQQRGLSRSHASIATDSTRRFAGQKLADPSFEDSLYAHPWLFRCSNRLVKLNAGEAHSGTNYLAAIDVPKTAENPSIAQDFNVGWDAVYSIDFGIFIRSANPVPPDRRIVLALWHYTGISNSDQSWICNIASRPMAVTNTWERYSLQLERTGGRYHRCEVYWFDDYPQEMNFDSAYCNVFRH